MEPPKVEGESTRRKRRHPESSVGSLSKPYHQLTTSEKVQRMNNAVKGLVTEADEQYLASLGREKVVEGLHLAWMDLTNNMVAHMRGTQKLSEENKKLREEVIRLQEKENTDKKAYDDVVLSHASTIRGLRSQKDYAEQKLNVARKELERANEALSEANQRVVEFSEDLGKSKATVIEEWKLSKDGRDYKRNADMGCYESGKAITLKCMKRALREVAPSCLLPWKRVEEKFDVLHAEEVNNLFAKRFDAKEDESKGGSRDVSCEEEVSDASTI